MKTIKNRIARTIVLVVSMMMSFPAFGQNADAVDVNLARRVGENFIKMNDNIRLSVKPGSLKRVETDKFPNLYIFNVDGGGSIIVAGDKRMQPILGFSDKGTFDPNNLPPAAEMIIGNYNSVVDSIVRSNVRSTDESIKQAWINLENGYYQEEKGVREEDSDYPLVCWPIITTKMNQGSLAHLGWQLDYNYYCPRYYFSDNSGQQIKVKAYTGCGATAMAQLLYHYKKGEPSDIVNKTANGHSVPAFYGAFLKQTNTDVNLELQGIDDVNQTFEYFGPNYYHWFPYFAWNYEYDDFVQLSVKIMYYCGLKLLSEYRLYQDPQIPYDPNEPLKGLKGVTNSSLNDIKNLLQTSFNFPKAFVKFRNYSDNWDDTLRKYISNDIPLLYRATPTYDNTVDPHIYIIDGYITTFEGVLFHHNLGWGGRDDGYYFSDFHIGLLGESYSLFPYNQFFLSIVPIDDKCKPNTHCLLTTSKDLREDQATNQIIYESVTKYHDYMDALSHHISRILCGTYWDDEEKGIEFWNLFQSLLDSNTGLIPEEGMQQLINQNEFEAVSEDFIRAMVDKYNQSVLYWNEGYYTNESLPEGYGNMIEYDTAAMRKAYEAQAYAESLGFSDVRQMYDNAYEMLEAEVENIHNSVCAKVTVQFSQKASMTREAFKGTLQIFNGHESIPMEDVFVDFRIKDTLGNDCTNLFQINTLSLDQITGISGDGSLAAQTNGTAMVQFIPTKNAAPTHPVVYSFGGSFSFIDPFTGEGLTYPFYPVEITVNPSPDLHIDYFMQRDILGDDAMTTDAVEPSIPAELAVIINNKGVGMAKNVTLETAEPQIADNENGLAISFKMFGSYLDGIERQLGLHGISFGNIEGGHTKVGEWLFTSSMLGHFISYNANVVHNSSFGNQDLSLVSSASIHELIHSIHAYGNLDDGINDFLVNDNPDAYDTPDSIYFSHGGKTSVGVVDEIEFDHLVSPSDTIVTLTVLPSRIGWNYGVTDDPGMNQYNIVSCIRNNDNQVIPLNNVWLTFVTIPDGGDPVYENKLHIVDTIPVQQTTTYTLVFAKKPSNLRIFHGNEDEYWSNVANWEGYIMPQADDEVLINGICLLDEDAEVFSLTVAENQSLTIPADKLLNVSGMLTSEATSRMIIEDGGQLKHRNEGVQATVKKNIEPYTNNDNGWYLIASPLSGFTTVASVTNMLSNEYDLYYYDEPTAYWITEECAANGFTELVNGKGYLYANSEGVVLEFPGTLRSGNTTVTVPLFYTEGTELKGFNLVGNPFVYNLTTYASHNVAEGCFRMNEAKDDLIVSEISEANPLKPAEGFFVKAFGEGATLTFNPQMNSAAPEGSIYVELSENNLLIDRLIVKTNEALSLKKFSLNETRTKLFAHDNRNEWALVPCASNEQPVSFKAAKNGTYTINVNADGMEFYYLHLIDNLTGNDVNLLAESSYTFDARTVDYASRFLLRFIPKDGSSTGSGTEHFAYCFNDKWIITNESDATLQVVDILGHVLSSERINGTCEKQLDAAAGVYLLRLINGNDVKVQKIVVR